ncbi:hypothetical protein M5K25_023448 [Dendrobium thyrsiflorum]|uniref:Uncharacterized protein n=1 Tax=Dendrobium thyrsiflorum TaxID=117978 RepID=A0ABD0U8D3_DENTH
MNGLDEIPRSDLARRDQTAGSRSRGTAAGGALDRELYSMEGFDLIPPESTSPAALTGWVLVGKFKEREEFEIDGINKEHHPSLGSLILKERKHLAYEEKRARRSYRKEALLPTGDPVWIFEIRMVPHRVLSITKTSNPKERRHDDSHLSLRKRDWMISWEGSIASQRSDLEHDDSHISLRKRKLGRLEWCHDGRTPPLVRLILRRGKNPNLEKKKAGKTRVVPRRAYSTTSRRSKLGWCHRGRAPPLVRLILRRGRNPNLKEKKIGRTRVVPRRAYSTTRWCHRGHTPPLEGLILRKECTMTHIYPRGNENWMISWEGSIASHRRSGLDVWNLNLGWCHRGRTPPLESLILRKECTMTHIYPRGKENWMISWEGSIASRRRSGLDVWNLNLGWCHRGRSPPLGSLILRRECTMTHICLNFQKRIS